MNNTVLIIEDDNDINNMLQTLLSNKGFSTVSAYSGTEGIMVHNKNIDIILLDLMLPGRSGDDIIKDLKSKHNVPVIVISAICDIEKKVDLFALGADDYITKPFHNDELLARISARLRNTDNIPVNDHKVKFRDIILDKNNFTVSCHGTTVELSHIEFELLRLLMENPKQTCTKSLIYDMIWNDENSADDNTLNVHISKLRKKLKQCDPENEYIETVWGIGYRLRQHS